MAPLRIGFNASGLAVAKPATGLERYLGNLLLELAARAEADDLSLHLYFAERVPPARYAPGTLLGKLRPSRAIRWRAAPTPRGWLRLGMGLCMALDRLHVFHFPAPHMAGFCPVPAVVTVHDLAAISLARAHSRKEAQYLPDAIHAARRAAALIAVSASARAEVRQHLGRQDVTVIPEGVDRRLFRPATPDAIAVTRARLNVSQYLLCVGTLQTRKNHLRLIEAFTRLQDQIPHTLVIAGRDGSGAEAVRAAAGANPRIRLIGYVEESALPALYGAADGLALPSLWEGFGLPVLEAMACGVPVLTSDRSALAEVGEGAALLVDPESTDAITDGLRALLTDVALRERLIAGGMARAAQYTWAEAARQTAALYRRVARSESPRLPERA